MLARAGLVSLQVLAALWVYQDGARRGQPAWVWVLGVAVAAPLAFPAYVLFVRPAQPEWDGPEVLAVGVLGLVAVPLGTSLVLGPWLGFRMVAAVVVAQSAALLAGCGQVLRRRGLAWRAVGVAAAGAPRALALGLLAALPAVAAVHYVVQPAAVHLLGLVIGHDEARALAELERYANPLVQVLPPLTDWPRVALFAMLVTGLVPVAEEVFFRGLVYRVARRALRPAQAAVLTGLLFAAVHLQVTNFLPIAVLGWAFAVAVERTGNLATSVAMHSVNNLVALVAAYGLR